MKDKSKNCIVCAGSALDGKIWIPPRCRPFWTVHNSRGNAIGDLYDEELDKYGLSEFKNRPFGHRQKGNPIHKIS